MSAVPTGWSRRKSWMARKMSRAKTASKAPQLLLQEMTVDDLRRGLDEARLQRQQAEEEVAVGVDAGHRLILGFDI